MVESDNQPHIKPHICMNKKFSVVLLLAIGKPDGEPFLRKTISEPFGGENFVSMILNGSITEKTGSKPEDKCQLKVDREKTFVSTEGSPEDPVEVTHVELRGAIFEEHVDLPHVTELLVNGWEFANLAEAAANRIFVTDALREADRIRTERVNEQWRTNGGGKVDTSPAQTGGEDDLFAFAASATDSGTPPAESTPTKALVSCDPGD